jgi:hypothetical protein
MEQFDLSKISIFFHVADFERKTSNIHINRIVNAILENKFFDNIVRVIKNPKGGFEVIDGQHRLAALWICHTEHALKHYDLVLQIFKDEKARTVYRKINMGKPLLAHDHTRALDDGSIPFFNECRKYLSHKRTDKKGSFVEMLSAIYYAKNNVPLPASAQRLESILAQISDYDIKKVNQMCESLYLESPLIRDSMYFRPIIARNVFKIMYEYDLDIIDTCSILNKAVVNEKIKWRLDKNTLRYIGECYDIIVREAVPLAGITLPPKCKLED